MKFYAGVGARKTPQYILAFMTTVAKALTERGWVLRSGGADGADSAFEEGALNAANSQHPPELPDIEIYLPWPGFNRRYNA